ncbi:uncharacterized protein DS421_13g403880 [Arachis hypogaea]|nr:uncharacterized protein DS421_13g403880 [Arachis hypogaea]
MDLDFNLLDTGCLALAILVTALRHLLYHCLSPFLCLRFISLMIFFSLDFVIQTISSNNYFK